MGKNDNSNIDNSSFNINNSNFSGSKEVHIGNKIHQEIHDNSTTYEVEMDDVKNIETFSKYITTHYSEPKIGIIGGISIISGLISIFTFLNSLMSNIKIISFLPTFSPKYGYLFITLGILLIVFGSLLFNALTYRQISRCQKCHKDYAYIPSKETKVTDIEVRGGTRRKKIKYFKCRYCGDETERKSNKFIPYEESDSEED